MRITRHVLTAATLVAFLAPAARAQSDRALDITEAAIGARGYSAVTTFLSSNDGGLTPVGTLSNPSPNGITQPQGNSLGLATGAGGVIDFVDQDSKPGYVQQYSLDWQRELSAGMAIAVGYMGSRSERLPRPLASNT